MCHADAIAVTLIGLWSSSKVNDKIKVPKGLKGLFQFSLKIELKKKEHYPFVIYFILIRSNCRSVYFGCIPLQQLVHEASWSDKARTRSFLAAPSLRSHSTGQLH